MKICSKFTGEHPSRSTISIKLQSSFIENTLRHGCSAVNLLHIFGTPFLRTPLNDCFCINYFRKLFHHRCLTESRINLWKGIIGSNETITRNIGEVNFFFFSNEFFYQSYSICIFVCWSFNITFLISTNIGSNLTCIILNKMKWFSCQ